MKRTTPIAFAGLILLLSHAALAQQTSATEVAVGFSAHFPRDVNAQPQCRQLGLPCSSPRTVPDGGAALSISRYLTEQIAVTGEAGAYINSWRSWGSLNGRPDENRVYSLLGGVHVATPFVHIRRYEPDAFRIFGQVLAGVEVSDVVAARRALQPGGGIDIATHVPGVYVRIEGDYRSVPGPGRNLSGSRGLFAFVVNPGGGEP